MVGPGYFLLVFEDDTNGDTVPTRVRMNKLRFDN